MGGAAADRDQGGHMSLQHLTNRAKGCQAEEDSVISWRPPCDGYIAAAGPVLKGSSAPKVWVARRKYESCAMLQLLRACVAQEEGWAAPAIHEASSSEPALSVSELRMQRTGRTTLIKNEQGKGLRLPKLLAEIVDLT